MKRKDIIFGLLIAVILAIFAFLASSSPDGLERVAEDQNFIHKENSVINSPLPDYRVASIKNEKISTATAGIMGASVVFIAAVLIGKILERK